MSSVLVIDDEPKVCRLLERTLRSDALAVESCVDPDVGLQRLREQPFDIVITDLRMPGMDGLEVLRRARAIRPLCEVVLMTAHATVATAREALKQGAVDYITKPFSIDDEMTFCGRIVVTRNYGLLAGGSAPGTTLSL